MKNFLHRISAPHTHGGDKKARPQHDSDRQRPPAAQLPSDEDEDIFSPQNIYRYRQQRGVNLGSWFVLERWISSEPFKHARAPAQSDLDIARGAHAKEVLEAHWDRWIREEDWEFIVKRGVNSVRIPIGYYHICGADPGVLHGTDFEPFYDVYRGAWSMITRAISTAASYGIGVLIDLHAAPGKQNNDTHAGTSGPANFFRDTHNQKRAIAALTALTTHLRLFTRSFEPALPNVIGIELLNEPSPPADAQLKAWYKAAIAAVRAVDSTIPVYLGECWRPEAYADFVARDLPLSRDAALTVLDHHLYRCFTPSDIATSAQTHCQVLLDPANPTAHALARAAEKMGRAGGGLVVGEWSGALNPGSLHGAVDVVGEQRAWVNAQLAFFERTCAGYFWWTYKKQESGDTGWSWRDAVERGVFPTFVGVRRQGCDDVMDGQGKAKRQAVREEGRRGALAQHTKYWSQYPGRYDHSRFAEGYDLGWHDAWRFVLSTFTSTSTSTSPSPSLNQLGFKAAWARKRTHDHGAAYWEFEAGFVQGADAVGAYCSSQHM